MNNQVSIDRSLFNWPTESLQLFGGKCHACGNICFPIVKDCPKCGGSEIVSMPLSTRGNLWTWTKQTFMPSPPYLGPMEPDTFKPFYVGFIELPDGIIVESILIMDQFEEPEIGMEMELDVFNLGTNDTGDDVMCYAFRPSQ